MDSRAEDATAPAAPSGSADIARLRRLLAGQARLLHSERSGVAACLHNDLQQMLVTILMRISALKRDVKDEQTAKGLEAINGVAQQAMERARQLSADIYPPILQHGSLADALHWLAGKTTKETGMAIEFSKGKGLEPPHPDIKHVAFDAAQAVLEHFDALLRVKAAALEVNADGDSLVLRLTGDAEGNIPVPGDDARDGLLCAIELTKHYGGEANATSAGGKVAVELRLPLTVQSPET